MLRAVGFLHLPYLISRENAIHIKLAL